MKKEWSVKIKQSVKNLHIGYHIKNAFRLGMLIIIYWILLITGSLVVVPHIAGYLAGSLRITYESANLDIAIWLFCTLFAVGLLFVGTLYLMKYIYKGWNRLFVKTMAEKKAIQKLKERKYEEEESVILKEFGIDNTDISNKKSRSFSKK